MIIPTTHVRMYVPRVVLPGLGDAEVIVQAIRGAGQEARDPYDVLLVGQHRAGHAPEDVVLLVVPHGHGAADDRVALRVEEGELRGVAVRAQGQAPVL